MKTPELEKEFELLQRAQAFTRKERPLREMEMTPEDKKRIRGFMFLSEKPILYVLNIGESADLGNELEKRRRNPASRSLPGAREPGPPPSAAKWKPSWRR